MFNQVKKVAGIGFATTMMLAATANNAQALVFDFNWSSDAPTFVPTSVSPTLSPGQVFSATGTIEIDKNAGETFALSDIVNTDITIDDGRGNTSNSTAWFDAGGSISADGLSASFDAAGNPLIFQSPNYFGCQAAGCADSIIGFSLDNFVNNSSFTYDSPATALASMQMTTTATPVPFGVSTDLSLLILGGLYGASRLRKKLASK